MKRLASMFGAMLSPFLTSSPNPDHEIKLVVDEPPPEIPWKQPETPQRERVLAYRRRERRPMATAVVVRTGRYFDRLSNGTLVRAGSRR